MSILLPPRGMNKGAYRGKLTCPVCSSEANRRLENVGPFRIRYKCRKCGLTYQYDVSNSPNPNQLMTHPYALFNKNKWRDIVESHGRTNKRR